MVKHLSARHAIQVQTRDLVRDPSLGDPSPPDNAREIIVDVVGYRAAEERSDTRRQTRKEEMEARHGALRLQGTLASAHDPSTDSPGEGGAPIAILGREPGEVPIEPGTSTFAPSLLSHHSTEDSAPQLNQHRLFTRNPRFS